MAYTETTSTSYGQRLAGSAKGMIGGLLMFIIGTCLLWWNEGRTVRTAKAIGDAASHVESVADVSRVDASLNGKLIGSAQRVPTPTGSTTLLYAVVEGKVTVDQVNAQMKKEATESFAYNEDEIVSSDIIGTTYGSIFDATQTMVSDTGDGNTLVQVVSWYDNENSYTSQMVRTIKYFAELG